MSLPSISIIMPVYNVGPYVEDCLRSVMRQTYSGPMECIVVDDCSTDDSIEKVEGQIAEYRGPIIFRILRHDYNHGVYAARNTGMDAASGDFLFFIDSDDEISDDCIAVLIKPLEQEHFDVIEGKYTESNDCFSPRKDTIEIESLRSPQILRNYKIKWGVPVWNRLYSISFIRNNQLRFTNNICEDILWSFQVACIAESLCVIDCITYHYKRREQSLTSPNNAEKRYNALITNIQEMRAFVDSHNVNWDDVFRLFYYYFNSAIHFYSSSLSKYASTYISLRPFFKVSLHNLLQKNHFHIKANIHDFHFLLPRVIAPYWQYLVFYRIRSRVKSSAS